MGTSSLHNYERTVVMKKQLNSTGIYVRWSKDEGTSQETNSISTQKLMLHDYAKAHGLLVHDVYADDGYTGLNYERPEFQRMRDDIEAGKINCVLCKDMSRLGRINTTTMHYIDIFFPSHNVRFIAVNDGMDTEFGESEMTPFRAVMNEMYSKDISKKVTSAFRAQAKRGDHLGSFAPIGYKKDENNRRKLVVDEESAPLVRRIFSMANDGLSIQQIARIFTKEHILTIGARRYLATGHISPNFDPAYKYNWTPFTLKAILQNPVYIGCIANHRQAIVNFKTGKRANISREDWIVVENTHEAIIERDVFEKIQRELQIKHRPNKAKVENIFVGMVKCADCGGAMACRSMANNQRNFSCNRNSSHINVEGTRNCTAHYINYNDLEQYVLNAINKEIQRGVNVSCFINVAKENSNIKKNQEQLDVLMRREADSMRLIKTVFEKNANGLISDEIFSELMKGYQDDIEQNSQEILKVQGEIDSINNQADSISKYAELIQKYSQPQTTLTRGLLTDLVEKIVVHEATSPKYATKNRVQRIDIYFRYIGAI